ncbi:DUF6734 family protein [Bacteroides heparinolyticus]|uniref:DUF6734 family protein n=2 Tax=Prevotella heparinolytica TaxID=28113 RepID=UPI00359FF969
MQAIHVTHSAPFFSKMSNRGKEYKISDFELLTTILSALKWREINGDIRLYTDTFAYDFYKSQNMLKIWNSGINVNVLDNIQENIDFEIFWAAGKLFALRNENTPCVMMDTDFICWVDISKLIEKDSKIKCIHREEIVNDVYLPYYLLKIPLGYKFNPYWDWSEKPCNTAFFYMADETIKQYYINEAFRFMDNNVEKPQELVSQMVFAEQRLLSMCAKLKGVRIDSFTTLKDLFCQNSFTHLWGYKRALEQDYITEYMYCRLIVERLLSDFKELHSMLLDIPILRKYV